MLKFESLFWILLFLDPVVFRSVSDILNKDLNPSMKVVSLDEQDNAESYEDTKEPPQPTPRRSAHRRVHCESI